MWHSGCPHGLVRTGVRLGREKAQHPLYFQALRCLTWLQEATYNKKPVRPFRLFVLCDCSECYSGLYDGECSLQLLCFFLLSLHSVLLWLILPHFRWLWPNITQLNEVVFGAVRIREQITCWSLGMSSRVSHVISMSFSFCVSGPGKIDLGAV